MRSFHTFRSLLGLAVGLLAAPLCAQDDPPPAASAAVQTEQKMVIATADDSSGEVQMSAIQITGDGNGQFMAMAPMVNFVMAPTDMSDAILNDPDVQQELELLDDQKQQLQKMQQDFGREMKSIVDDAMSGRDPEKRDRLREALAEFKQRQREQMNQILLPHQLDRLKQISFQMNVKNSGMENVLLSKKIAEELGLDEEQQKKLKERAAELKAEFDEQVAKLKQEMRHDLLQELTPEQRKKVEEMTGDEYTFKEPEGLPFRSRFGRTPRPSAGGGDKN